MTRRASTEAKPDELLPVAQDLTKRLLGRAALPLVFVMALTAWRVVLGTYGSRGTIILLWGALIAAVTMLLYALPTLLMAKGHPRPPWTGVATVLGVLPLLYGVYLGAIGGALGAFRAESILEAVLGVLFLLAGFAFVRDFTRLAVIGRGIEAAVGQE